MRIGLFNLQLLDFKTKFLRFPFPLSLKSFIATTTKKERPEKLKEGLTGIFCITPAC